jgi:hypothetical protein
MSAETASPAAGLRSAASRRADRPIHPVVDVLADGTACYAPVGEVIVDGGRVTCHLCGRSLRSVAAHLASHGWTKEQYCAAFGLERGQSLEGSETRKLRAAAFTARLVFDPAIREGSAAGRERARAGDLAQDAATAARGRAFPAQRRRKAARAAGKVAPAVAARANRARADRRLADIAAAVARRHGYPDIQAFVMERQNAGASLTAISREAGLHKDWLSRHLSRLDPPATAAARQRGLDQRGPDRSGPDQHSPDQRGPDQPDPDQHSPDQHSPDQHSPDQHSPDQLGAGQQHNPDRRDAPWLPVLRRLGYPDVASYLRERHLRQHLTVHAIAVEMGISHHAVESALRRHALARVPHAAKRHAAAQRAAEVAAGLGFGSVAAYVAHRRTAGWTWQAMSAESGQPQTWLRRHAGDAPDARHARDARRPRHAGDAAAIPAPEGTGP